MAEHSKRAEIKCPKAARDAKHGKVFAKTTREMTT